MDASPSQQQRLKTCQPWLNPPYILELMIIPYKQMLPTKEIVVLSHYHNMKEMKGRTLGKQWPATGNSFRHPHSSGGSCLGKRKLLSQSLES
nr:hypothetical protein Iba_chr02eCG1490 [Ipomoea batatas]GME08238.1 hypothetical protein Iba_scaffold7383CG0080 [Ipomoea batatas]GME13581.1 hypothetical protein Iba_scaffold14542CG0030 [Ipomoea batatas]